VIRTGTFLASIRGVTLTAGDLMTGDILLVRPEWSLTTLTAFLADHSISGAPVVATDGRLVGVVSLTDVARSSAGRAKGASKHEQYTDGPAFVFAPTRRETGAKRPRPHVTVNDIMTPMVFDVPASATVPEIADAMVRGRIHRVFVTEGGMVIGIISALDLLRVLL